MTRIGPCSIEVLEAGLLRGFPDGGLGRGLVALEVALGKAPILVGIPDQEIPRGLARHPAEHDAAGADLQLRTTLIHLENARFSDTSWGWPGCRSAAPGTESPSCVVSRYSVESEASMPRVPLPAWILVISESAAWRTRTRLVSLARAAAITERRSAAACRRSALDCVSC